MIHTSKWWLTLNTSSTYLFNIHFKYIPTPNMSAIQISFTSMIKMRFLEKPWVTVGEWCCALKALTKCMVRSSHRKETTLPNGPQMDGQIPKVLDWTTGVLKGPPGPRTFGQPVIPDPSAPRWFRPWASPTGGVGWPWGEERAPLASWLSCRLLHLTYHSTSPRLW